MDWIADHKPAVIPPLWRMDQRNADGWRFVNRVAQLSVILSGAVEQDGKRWLHLSMASPDRLPTWDELRAVKDWAIGVDTYAVQVLPPRERYVNIHPYCLHLFACVDGHPLPDFTRGGASL